MAKKINELDNISALTDTCVFITQDVGATNQVTAKVSLATFLSWLTTGHTFPFDTAKFLSGNGIQINTDNGNVTYTAKLGEGLEFDADGNIKVTGGTSSGNYLWIRYADDEPTADSDIKTTPSNYMGIYSGEETTAPTAYTSYQWFKIKGEQGETTVTSSAVNLTGTLTADGWSDTVPYTQTATVTGLSANGNPILDLVVSADTATGISENKEWAYITKAETAENTLTVKCYENKPSVDLNFIIKVV